MEQPLTRIWKIQLSCHFLLSCVYIRRIIASLSLLFSICVFLAAPTNAQVTPPANINGAFVVGASNLGGTTNNTQNAGMLGGLGLNQGETFGFSGAINSGSAQWASGFQFLTNQILQVQADGSALPGNPVQYEINFSDEVYGLQFRMSGFDNADETQVFFFLNGSPVPVVVNSYVDGVVTVTRPENIITFAGTNIDIDPIGNGFRVDGDGDDDANGIGIHGLQEGFTVNLPLGIAVDEVRFLSTGKNDGNGGNVTLIYTDFAWARPGIALTKGSVFSQGRNAESNVGDYIIYTYVVENVGNVPLTDVTLTETGFTGTGTMPVPVFSSGTGGATPAIFSQGETLTYTFNYPVTASDLLAGFVDNQGASFAMSDSSVTDVSDSLNTGDGGVVGSPDEDDPTTTTFPAPIVFNPSIEAVKIADSVGLSNPVVSGDIVSYMITVTNSGDVDLLDITLSDTLSNGDGTVLLPLAPAFVSSTSGSLEGTLSVGEIATYTFSYSVSQADVDSESLSNTVTANATAFTGGMIFDVSDDGDDGDGNVVDDPTLTLLPGAPLLSVTKSADPRIEVPVGQMITYTYRVENIGNQTLTNINLSDNHLGSGAPPIPAGEDLATVDDISPVGDSTDTISNDGTWDTLAPGDTVTFTAEYTVTQQDVDNLQ